MIHWHTCPSVDREQAHVYGRLHGPVRVRYDISTPVAACRHSDSVCIFRRGALNTLQIIVSRRSWFQMLATAAVDTSE